MSAEQVAAAGLPAASTAAAPAWVRDGSPELQHEYALGLEFEQLLSQQMASAMTAGAGLGEEAEGEEGAGAMPGGGVFSTMLSGALSQGVSDGGGLGVAAELARDMQAAGGSTKAVDGGTAARMDAGAGS
jgi:hypothetical protein